MGDVSTERTRHQILQSTVLSRITAGIVAVLLVVFFLTTIGNTATILSKVETVKNDPYPASVAAGHLETRLVQLRTLAMDAAYMRSPEALDSMLAAYREADSEILACIETINRCNSVNHDDAVALREGYNELRSRQTALIDIFSDPNATEEDVARYAVTNFYPLVTTLLQTDLSVLDESTRAVDSVYQAVNDACRQTIFISWILIMAVAISLFVYLTILRRKTRREEMLTQKLETALSLAQSASEAKSTFLSSMSHDIRTPMNAIVGLTAIASSHMDNPARVANCLERINVSSKHLLSLINDVLDMNEIESGKIVITHEALSLHTLIDEVADIVQPQARVKRLTMEVEVGPLEHDIVVGDSLRLHQILLNLASNALKYSKPRGWMRLSVAEEAGEDGPVHSYRFIVEDNGIGMDQEFLKRIFDPFTRERKENAPIIEGAGLGMSIIKRIIDAMGGTISVESKLDVGSKFTVVLPLEEGTLPPANDAGEADEDTPLSGRVLLVEDDALNREIAVELIQSFGVDVQTADDGLEALEMVQRNPDDAFALIFMDCQMPRMGGLEATERIIAFEQAQGRRHTPIVAMTANAFNEDRKKTIDAGMDGFISKPISMSELERHLRMYL